MHEKLSPNSSACAATLINCNPIDNLLVNFSFTSVISVDVSDRAC
jgi:hypothetical protein